MVAPRARAGTHKDVAGWRAMRTCSTAHRWRARRGPLTRRGSGEAGPGGACGAKTARELTGVSRAVRTPSSPRARGSVGGSEGAESGAREKKSGEREHPRERGSLLCMKKKIRQQEFGFVNWGGKRRGAGRKPKGERAGVSHAKRPRLPTRFPVLVTMKMCEGLETLRAKDVHAIIRAAIAAGRREDFRVVEYSLQNDQCVQERLTCSAGDRPAGARAKGPVAWMASEREIDRSEPIDEISVRGIASPRAATYVNA